MTSGPAPDPTVLAARLHAAWNDRVPIAPFSETGEIATAEEAYAAQQAWAAIRAGEGETTVGRKIGLTSPGMQRQMGVGEPDYGDLWGSRQATVADGSGRFDHRVFLQPRVEGEVAFLLGRDLEGPGVTAADVRAAAVAAAPAIEVVDSRIADWRIRLVDTIADNASYGGFALGPWSERMLADDLVAVEFALERDDEVVVRETGAAVLGSPLLAVAWLADKLASLGSGISAGDIVLSGSFGGAVAAAPGDAFTLRTAGEPPLTVHFDHEEHP
ncbi:MAG: 4-oxalocrotonate decarboxylase [Solirubrobacterales bacterium]|jgi:2-keto-4-pentenoate hydratase|nr:4-oxalocrotonate decarboxylase [Solirubrobacterales bacterium]